MATTPNSDYFVTNPQHTTTSLDVLPRVQVLFMFLNLLTIIPLGTTFANFQAAPPNRSSSLETSGKLLIYNI
jgi:hypothetical protein